MRSNLYHLLGFIPATERWEMPSALEALAQQLLASGKLRINADTNRNFVRHGDMTFSTRELSDPALVAATRARLSRHVAPAEGPDGLERLWTQLHQELKKARGVAAEKEQRVARVLAQSTHPAVMQLLLASGTEIFVSYAHNVADLMAVHDWKTHGENSGLQATDSDGTAVYISAGGDPFFEGEQKTYITDGFPALARMVIIAGQELGHFADLRRSARGIIGRHSTDINASRLRADPLARTARLADIQTVAAMARIMQRSGLPFLRRAEKALAFYHQRLRYSPPWFFCQLWRLLAWVSLGIRISMRQSNHQNNQDTLNLNCPDCKILLKINVHPKMRCAERVESFLADMAYNLAPDADVYRDPDPLVEEAIAVIEAVARVPQQVHKWGDAAVAAAWPGLYAFYQGTVIPAVIAAVADPISPPRQPLTQRIAIAIRRRLRAKPGYYP